MIRFLLNNELQTLDGVEPSLSVLQYLRTMAVLPGTKEGCAAGDCGACTVVVGELVEGRVEYQAVNSCITPVGSLQGKHLVTVEHLQQQGTLHPVQQAMVDCHGSQCGFCTPGIVMSLFAWYQAVLQGRAATDRHGVETALSGNLCRCTGYQPILRAAEQALASGVDLMKLRQMDVVAQLLEAQNLAAAPTLQLDGKQFLLPQSSDELARLLIAFPQARLVAGATDLGLEFTQQLQQPTQLISTTRVADMLQVDVGASALTIGGAVTYSRAQPALQQWFPAFGQLLQRLGSLQIRNQGTLGGNVANASPIGDTPPVLLALDAQLQLTCAAGTRTIALNRFFTGYRQTQLQSGEFIKAIVIPKLQNDERLWVYKISKRFDDDISAVCLALWLKLDGTRIVDVRIGCGGMAATPARAAQTEQALRGQPFTAESVAAAAAALAQDFAPLDDVRASAKYRLAVAGQLLKRAWLEWQGQVPVQLWVPAQNIATGGVAHG